MTSTKQASQAAIRRLFPPLPEWARTAHPLLRFQLGGARTASATRSARLARSIGLLALLIALIVGGWLIATRANMQAAGSYPVESVANVLYAPLLAAQVFVTVLSLLVTTGAIARAQRLQQWDAVRATSSGAALLLRTRWASVFYRLRLPLALVLGGRVLLLALMLYDLTAFQGRYIDLLINGIQPEISVLTGVLTLALLMTAAILLPITATGFDAAFGLLLSTFARQRNSSAIAQIVLIVFRLLLIAALLIASSALLTGGLALSDPLAWLLTTVSAGLGDWGLSMLYLGRAGEVWATVPFGVFIGAALIGLCFVQAALADVLLSWAGRRAQLQE